MCHFRVGDLVWHTIADRLGVIVNVANEWTCEVMMMDMRSRWWARDNIVVIARVQDAVDDVQ